MHQDFKELLSAFNAGQVRYLIVGGYAVSFHAQPRATKDLDILIGADAENSKAVYAALARFGAPIEGLIAMDFAEPDNFFSALNDLYSAILLNCMSNSFLIFCVFILWTSFILRSVLRI